MLVEQHITVISLFGAVLLVEIHCTSSTGNFKAGVNTSSMPQFKGFSVTVNNFYCRMI